ncbi:hypothetical protein VFPPC_17356 [Pochonia chlamydosporia 170]|uniref:Uncharacterized protein n=1 Tax=Pochonia chlamydosporia 170 TaxID=1380566 RepID=A0A219ATI1_METCM|nr:hypothetical protein VFPPC_17356 [Pochonia chlamydosporia 170]OWT43495.1 hypothetical protein VFPPC_17356 [Pochonia chlamydosporia 170]
MKHASSIVETHFKAATIAHMKRSTKLLLQRHTPQGALTLDLDTTDAGVREAHRWDQTWACNHQGREHMGSTDRPSLPHAVVSHGQLWPGMCPDILTQAEPGQVPFPGFDPSSSVQIPWLQWRGRAGGVQYSCPFLTGGGYGTQNSLQGPGRKKQMKIGSKSKKRGKAVAQNWFVGTLSYKSDVPRTCKGVFGNRLRRQEYERDRRGLQDAIPFWR